MTMKVALLADLHANLEALGACLGHAEAHGTDRWAFIGDIVGYGADPQAVTDIVMAYAATGATVVLGNHDAAAIGLGSENMNEQAEAAIRWTRGKLSNAHKEFLATLPLTVRDDGILFVHASAAAPDRWIYVSDPLRAAHSISASGATYVFSGHVHVPVLYFQGTDARPQPFRPVPGVPIPVPRHRRWLAIIGSCGQPRDGNPAACYALLDTDRAELTFFRLPYDHFVTARKIRAAGLPEKLALRIEQGR
jgi:diadenosine tetraphosphatase ApaH/serine/threonine PP2A family protein phosphatase